MIYGGQSVVIGAFTCAAAAPIAVLCVRSLLRHSRVFTAGAEFKEHKGRRCEKGMSRVRAARQPARGRGLAAFRDMVFVS